MNPKTTFCQLVATMIVAFAPQSVLAAPNLYLLGAFGLSEARDFNAFGFNSDQTLGQMQEDKEGTGFRVSGGLGFSRFLSIELGYTDLGEATFSAQSSGTPCCGITPVYQAGPVSGGIAVDGVEFSVTARWPLPEKAAMGIRLGYFKWTLDPDVRDSSGPMNLADKKGSDPLYGLNILIPVTQRYKISLDYVNYAIQAEGYTNRPVVGDYSTGLLSLGLIFSFGR